MSRQSVIIKSIISRIKRTRDITQTILKLIKSFVFPPILIYSVGKVGSTSVEVSLTKAHIKNPIFHVHRLTWHTLEKSHEYYRNAGLDVPSHVMVGEYLRFIIDRTRGKARWKIITLTRDPTAQTISSLFENLETHPQFRNLSGDDLIKGILALLEKRFNEFDEEHGYSNNWFDWELKNVFSFDVYAEDFEPEAGYKIAKSENADILILKLENLSRCAPEAFQKFLGLQNFQLIKANEGSDKSYKEVYQRVLSTLSLPRDTVERIYRSRYVRQFYTDEEINAFKRRWTRND